MSNPTLEHKESFNLWEVTSERKLNRPMLGFLAWEWKYLFLSKLRVLSQHVESRPTNNSPLTRFGSEKAIKHIGGPALLSKLLPLGHRRAVGVLSIFYWYFHRLCSVSHWKISKEIGPYASIHSSAAGNVNIAIPLFIYRQRVILWSKQTADIFLFLGHYVT